MPRPKIFAVFTSLPLRASLPFRAARASVAVALALVLGETNGAESGSGTASDLAEQNRQLQELVRAQRKTIDEINARMGEILRVSERHEQQLRGLQDRGDAASGSAVAAPGSRAVAGDAAFRISGEAGLAYFRTGAKGQFPNGAFRVDDPVIAVEAPVAKSVYLFTELRLQPRETTVEGFRIGEMYVDFEDVLARWGHPGLLSVRAGRVNIPFGEEYLRRGPVANPLISHSLSDTWGWDEGLEIYGRLGAVQYVLAVQNGGPSQLNDFDSDKSVAGRLSWEPARWLHVSGSAMRTGQLATVADNVSELWFGNGFFRALGSAATTATFEASLFQADATARWKRGQVGVTFGQVHFNDSDTTTDNSRRLRYGMLELVQQITDPLYIAARHSEIRAPGGYPLAGWGPLATFFFRPGVVTEELRRTSVGLGYRFGAPLILKVEYTWESGRMTNGLPRDQENFVGTELAVKF